MKCEGGRGEGGRGMKLRNFKRERERERERERPYKIFPMLSVYFQSLRGVHLPIIWSQSQCVLYNIKVSLLVGCFSATYT